MSEWARPDAAGDPEPSDIELFEVFATGTTVLRANEQEPESVNLSTHLHRCGEAVRDGVEHARDFRARPGPRPGQPRTTSTRDGGDADIVRPVLIDPWRASLLATTGELFAAPIDHLQIRVDTDDDRYLAWDACLTTTQGSTIAATLHLLGSPSMVVTVLELVPRRRLRWRRDDFVTDGVEALEELAHRLEAAA